ncbi:MAG: site-specific DNA-methyltransferase [Mollicutes bacterium UO1]
MHVSNTTEYILVYAKKEEMANTERLERPESLDKKYSNPDNDPLGRWIISDPSAKRDNFGSVYAIQNPFTGSLLLPPSGRSWGWQKSKIKSWLEEYGSEYEEYDLQDGKASALILKGANKFNDLTTNSVTEKAS